MNHKKEKEILRLISDLRNSAISSMLKFQEQEDFGKALYFKGKADSLEGLLLILSVDLY